MAIYVTLTEQKISQRSTWNWRNIQWIQKKKQIPYEVYRVRLLSAINRHLEFAKKKDLNVKQVKARSTLFASSFHICSHRRKHKKLECWKWICLDNFFFVSQFIRTKVWFKMKIKIKLIHIMWWTKKMLKGI